MVKAVALNIAILIPALAAVAGDDIPAQFKAWGSRGPGLPPIPTGWTEVPAEPRVRRPPEFSKAEVDHGFILFQRRPFTAVYHDTVPAPFERAVTLEAFAARGQYEPVSFAVYAISELKDFRVGVGELQNQAGDTIPASHIDLRQVMAVRSQVRKDAGQKQFSRIPFYLEKFDRLNVRKGETAQLWLTLKVPEGAKGGDYRGWVRIQAGERTVEKIPVTIKVLPFNLPPIPLETAVSYFPAEDLVVREKEMIDQREHGILANESSLAAQVLSRDRHFGEDDAEATRKSIKTTLNLRRKVYGGAADRFPLTVEVGHQILYSWNTQKAWFEFWPRSPELEIDFFKAVAVCQESVRNEVGASIRVFIMDEPGGHPDTLQETLHYYKLLKQKLPDIQTYVTLGGGLSLGIDELGLLSPYVDLITVNRVDEDICKQLAERRRPFGIYNGGGATEAVTGLTRDRYFYGFYGWSMGAGEILQWVYRFGEPWKEAFRGNHGYTMPAPDGPLPSIPWEGIRAGVDDYRYVDLLWRLITAAKSDPKAAEAARAGEQAALEVLRNIDLRYQPRTGAGTPAPACGTLDRWRWQIANACRELLNHVPLQKALTTTPIRPDPLELPRPKTEASVLAHGPELLPNTDFENGAAPWKMAGQPVSRGGLDQSVAHSGTNSFMLENAGNASGMDVVVCVWGWGGPGPNMTLLAGKTYEFSAMIKASSTKPQIRLAVPENCLTHDEEGEDPAEPAGWRRLWRRVTLKQDAKPTYLAIWLQGPGKIWVDDLRFSESLLPPFVLEAEQTVLDGSDKNLTVGIRQFGPTEISVKIEPPGKRPPRIVLVPPRGEAMLDIDPAMLPVGSHQLKAGLVDQKGESYSRTVEFTRVVGPFDK